MRLPYLSLRSPVVPRGGSLVLLALAGVLLATGDAAAQREAWRRDRSCGAGGGPGAFRVQEMADSTTESTAEDRPCSYGACMDLPGGRRICGCPTDSGSYVFHLQRPGAATLTWNAGRGSAGLSRFDVVDGDLDGDGAPETAIVRLVDHGNGLGVTFWRMAVIDGRRPEAPPAVLELREYAFADTFLRPAAGGPCRVLVGRWVNGRERARGPGLYFEARWMRYAAGAFTHDETRPIVRRRYTFAFQEQRIGDEDSGPYAWLRTRGSAAIPGFVEIPDEAF